MENVKEAEETIEAGEVDEEEVDPFDAYEGLVAASDDLAKETAGHRERLRALAGQLRQGAQGDGTVAALLDEISETIMPLMDDLAKRVAEIVQVSAENVDLLRSMVDEIVAPEAQVDEAGVASRLAVDDARPILLAIAELSMVLGVAAQQNPGQAQIVERIASLGALSHRVREITQGELEDVVTAVPAAEEQK